MDSHCPPFKALDTDPGGTKKQFIEYVDQMKLLFQLCFRKADGTSYTPTDNEKKAMMLYKGEKDMKNLYEHVGKVVEADTFEEAVQKIKEGLDARTNKVVQRNMLFTTFPQGSKSFERWSQEVCNAAKLISYANYDWSQAAVDAILLQTSNSKLRERALQENITYDQLLKLGIAKEQSVKGAALLEKMSGRPSQNTSMEEEVRRLTFENERLKRGKDRATNNKTYKNKPPQPWQTKKECGHCGITSCKRGTKCPARGQQCGKCGKMNHYARACKTKSSQDCGQLSCDSSDEDDCCQITTEENENESIVVGKINSKSITANVEIKGMIPIPLENNTIKMATDTGVKKTILNYNDWKIIKKSSGKVKTSKKFRPYGTDASLKILGKALVTLKAENGAKILTWVYIHDSKLEKSLLGEIDAIRLGIVKINLKGATHEVMIDDEDDDLLDVQRIQYARRDRITTGTVSGDQSQEQIDRKMEALKAKYPKAFTNRTGKFNGAPIKIHHQENYVPHIQPSRRIPLHYVDATYSEIEKMIQEDVFEGPIEVEEPGTFINNLVITDKKNNPGNVRLTIDCREVNKILYSTHETIPTVEELRHELEGSDRFSVLDLTNCYNQFEIEEEARKLFAFRTRWGIFRPKRLVQGASPSSSEAQKKVREILSGCKKVFNIKDDVVVHGVGEEHDANLEKAIQKIEKAGLTLRPNKCHLGKPEIKWFGNVFSKDGMSPDPDKCKVIKEWPAPTTIAEVKSFLQTVQFNSKFLASEEPGSLSYQELTAPLREMSKKGARFIWGDREAKCFQELKDRLNSEKVLVPYNTKLKTRLYVDSSYLGTQATVAQQHIVHGEMVWRPVNHTSRKWTPAEAGYGQIERESNGIQTGMHMNRMYTLGTEVEIVTDHEPLLDAYQRPKPKQLRIDRHRTKLFGFDYTLTYEPGKTSPCDYGSRHPPATQFTAEQIDDWSVEEGDEIYVNRIIEEILPQAIKLKSVQHETKKDATLQKLISVIGRQDHMGKEPDLKPYKDIYAELSTINGIVMRGEQIVLPSTLWVPAVTAAHEGHLYADKTLQLLRRTCWFPGMRKTVYDYVESCLPCNASSPHNPPVPLQPNLLPDRAWQKLHCDFKGPIANKYYLHVIIDQYSKYPEVDILTSTSFKKLRPVLDRVFACHGIPETLSSDNSPYNCHEMEVYAQEMGFEFTPVSPEDPQCNGFAENFVKQLCKLLHTSIAEGKDAKSELYKYLLQYRAAPHCTTGKPPAEMLFNRKVKTKLPQVFTATETKEQKQIREVHDNKKLKQKQHFDRRHKARPKELGVGDQVLLRQQKSTIKPHFDPNPYTVSGTRGNQVHLQREDGSSRVRDKNKVKKVVPRPAYLQQQSIPQPLCPETQSDEFPSPSYIATPTIQPSDPSLVSVSNDVVHRSTNGNEPGSNPENINTTNEGPLDAGETPTVAHPNSDASIDTTAHADASLSITTEVNTSDIPTDRDSIASGAEVNDHSTPLFTINGDMQATLERLLEAASERSSAPVTRSQGVDIQWNNTMNPDDVINYSND